TMPPIEAQELYDTLAAFLTEKQRAYFETNLELDLALIFPEKARVRINMYNDLGSVGCAMRLVPLAVPGLAELGLPPVVERLSRNRSGLLLVTGVTGSGKSTTLAAIIDEINRNSACHIYTIEDPVEFVHSPVRSLITQREIGYNTTGFAGAVRSALRADPNVLMIGEMRDKETILTALTAAETGLMVLSTLHTGSATKTIQRILSFFEPKEQEAIRHQLAYALRAVICQQLLPMIHGGRQPFHEIMVNTATIQEAILLGEFEKLQEYIRNGSYDGMCTMDESIFNAYCAGDLSGETAQAFAMDREHMERALRGAMLT
ncbi:MAG TPA: PilT/PilU family type 4a pilus ATPase, partial [Chroococcales cyanobacterium]